MNEATFAGFWYSFGFILCYIRDHFEDENCWQTVIHKFYFHTVMVLFLPSSVQRAVVMEWWRGQCNVWQRMVRKAIGVLKMTCQRPEKSAEIQVVSTTRKVLQDYQGYVQAKWKPVLAMAWLNPVISETWPGVRYLWSEANIKDSLSSVFTSLW